jgi:hypothetical protein
MLTDSENERAEEQYSNLCNQRDVATTTAVASRTEQIDLNNDKSSHGEGENGIRKMRDWRKEPRPVTKLGEHGYVGDITKDVRFYDEKGELIQRTPMVNVMLLEEESHAELAVNGVGAGTARVCRRSGVGMVYLARWIDAEPQTSTIVLY